MSDAAQDEVTADIAGQKLSLKSASLNTIATVATLVGVGVLVWVMYGHQQDARDANAAFVAAVKEQTVAIKEQTSATREQTCLIVFKDADQCRRLTR